MEAGRGVMYEVGLSREDALCQIVGVNRFGTWLR